MMLIKNKSLQFEIAVAKLQYTYSKYLESVIKSVELTFFDDEGEYCTLEGYDESIRRMMKLENELRISKEYVDNLRDELNTIESDPRKLN